MGLEHAHEHDTHEVGAHAAICLLTENCIRGHADMAVRHRCEEALGRRSLVALDAIPVDIDEAETNRPDIMWCHWCDAWRETGIDGGGTLHRRCVECGHEIRCDDCSQRVSAEGWCTTKGCPSNPIYSP